MKKKLLIFVLVGSVAVGAIAAYSFLHRRGPARHQPELRAMMRDEAAELPPQPSVGLSVNGEHEVTVFTGAPVWLTVGVSNQRAANRLAAAGAAAAPVRATVTLGDAGHSWTDAVEFVVREGQGERPLPFSVSPAGSHAGQPLELDGRRTADADFCTPSPQVAAGAYAIAACIHATGSWNGRACSASVRLTVTDRPAELTADQQDAMDRQCTEFATVISDFAALESCGRKLVARHPDSITGHRSIGEAKFSQGKWSEALQEYTTARSQFLRQYPNAAEPPISLNWRIQQLLAKLDERVETDK